MATPSDEVRASCKKMRSQGNDVIRVTQQMRAVVVRQTGGPGSVEVIEVDRPEPGLAQVRVRVHAATLNPVDAGVWSGAFGRPADGGYLAIGWEFSGVVDAVGPMANLAQGDTVIGYVQEPVLAQGAQADYEGHRTTAARP